MDFKLPELGEGVYEAELVAWLVGVGDTVKRGQNLMEVLTDKATMEVPSPFAGTIQELKVQPGDVMKIDDVALSYEPAEAAAVDKKEPVAVSSREETTPVAPLAPAQPSSGSNGPFQTNLSVKAAPSVRLMARQLGIDIHHIRGSGPGGRILIEDLSRYLQPSETPKQPPAPLQDFGTPGTRIKLAGLRRKIAETMVRSKTTIPHYSYVDECDVTELVRLRDSLKGQTAAKGIKLTYVAFLVKAVAAALQEVPIVNASLDDEAGEIVLHDRYHIGVAVATPQGLIVPVIHDADKKNLLEIARDIGRLSSDARGGKIQREDLLDGTFTITSIGNIGGLFSTPIVNPPQVGIAGLGKVVRRPVFDEAGHIRPADMMYLSFTFDHRVVDGAVGAAFGNAVIKQLQNPAALLIADAFV